MRRFIVVCEEEAAKSGWVLERVLIGAARNERVHIFSDKADALRWADRLNAIADDAHAIDRALWPLRKL